MFCFRNINLFIPLIFPSGSGINRGTFLKVTAFIKLDSARLSKLSTLAISLYLHKLLIMYVHHVSAGTYGSQKRATDPLDLKLLMGVSCHMSAGN